MKIQELFQASGVPTKTIRFYEEIGVLPSPKRKPNGYSEYNQANIERLRLVAGARRLDLSLNDIREIIAFPLNQKAQCLLMGAPTTVSEKQLRDVHIRIDPTALAKK